MLIAALAGTVMTQESAISRSMLRLKARIPRARPTPKTAPTRQCVVEMGSPSLEANKIVVAAPNSAQKPRVGVSSVIFLPIVSITRHPQVARPDDDAKATEGEQPRGDSGDIRDHPIFNDVEHGGDRADRISDIVGSVRKCDETGA